ncbi:MAG: non-ribosomal peptide synthase protein (TIGR01720 family) [Planctomycetota bacterium]|jgi:non-ribosomal peptide synthase protein (TIGR01720 family)
MSDEQSDEYTGFEVAIVGVAGRFPGASDVAAFWQNLRGGVESIVFMTEEELLEAGEDPDKIRQPNYVPASALLEDYDMFDAGFFGFTPREAEIMDPQHRLFLEYSWSALENAGYDCSRFTGPVGVYGGTGSSEYLVNNVATSGLVDRLGMSVMFGNHNDYVTTRVSYKLNLSGPSFGVQTACSTSAIAIHLASQALLAGDCDMALAGGASLSLPHKRGYLHAEQGIYSPDGHCRAFAKDAEGTAGGSGVAVVVLRRLEDAIEAGDSIIAVIKGSAINNDGSNKVGYAAPSVDGQAEVIQNALSMAEVDAREIGLIEAHGTGTTMGDPIEIAGLTQAYRAQTEDNGFCAIGSVKTNVGHLGATAGVAGVLKAALAIQNREMPPSLNCETSSPACDFPNTPFFVNTKLTEWKDAKRRAGVSSFGIGGTNAHLILEQAPDVEPATASRSRQLIVLSARSPKTLDDATSNFVEHLRVNPNLNLADAAHTLQVGRKGFDHRRIVSGTSAADVIAALDPLDRKRVRSLVQVEADRGVAFLFPGQGSQYVGMGRELYDTEPTFREHVDAGAELLKSSLGFDLREVIYAQGGDEAAAKRLAQTSITQPALFVIEYALAKLWMDWGLVPEAMIGHSIGEYVAATLSGVFDYESGLKLVTERGRLMQALPAGAMLAVSVPAAEVEPKLSAELSIAAINEESACVVSGTFEAIEAFEKQLESERVACRRLHTSHAFHSAMMDPALAAFTELVLAASPKAPTIPFLSNLTGTWITAAEATDPAYWANHLRGAVRFADGVKVLIEVPERVLLEVGPGNTLTTLASRTARRAECEGFVAIASMRHPRETQSDLEQLLDALGQLWMARVTIDWDGFYTRETRRRIPLPSYPFARERFWIEPGQAGQSAPIVGRKPKIEDWFYVQSWQRSSAMLTASDLPTADEYLIFHSEDGLGEQLKATLVEAGKRVTTVIVGERMTELDADQFALRPENRRDHEVLANTLKERNRLPEVVLNLWSCGASSSSSQAILDRGFYSLLHFAQAFGCLDDAPKIELVAVTSDTCSVIGGEFLSPEKAAVLGACQAIPQEITSLDCRVIDIEQGGISRSAEILKEVALGSPESLVAYRKTNRWVQRFEALPVTGQADENVNPRMLRDNGHYLITGGLGSIGLEVASALAAAPGAKLVLTSRRDFYPRAEWDAWLSSHEESDETSLRIRKLQSIEQMGATISIVCADVSDIESMRSTLGAAEAEFGPLNGLVHAAGAEKVQTILQETTREECAAQFAPKLAGLTVLEELLSERELDFCIIQSSLSSMLGSLGMVGYVGAHQLVDAFVLRHNQGESQAWTRVNWDNWLSWKEPEIGHSTGEAAYYMTPDEGAEAFRRVLNLPLGTQLALSTGDLDARIAEWSSSRNADAANKDSGADLHARPDLGSEFEAPSNPVEAALAKAWSDILGIGNIGIHDSFFELGGDSVLGLQVVAKASQAGYRITPAMIFQHSTIAELATVAESRQTTLIEQGAVEGTAPLCPIQHWFFNQDVPTPAHFNLPMMFEVPADSQPEWISSALADVVGHHDALRMRYRQTDAGVEQFFDPGAVEVDLSVKDLSELPEADYEAAMLELATKLHHSLDLEQGPLMRAALFQRGANRPAVLLWIMHHLLIDVVGWRTVIEDFHTARKAHAAGRTVKLPAKTTSFQAWAKGQSAAAQTDARRAELDTWLDIGKHAIGQVPTEITTGDNDFASSRTVTVNLDEAKTTALLQQVPSVYETRIDEVLLTALVTGYSSWASERGGTSKDQVFVDLEGHGREDIVPDADLSRTVGWFTTIYPALLSLTGVSGAGEGLKSVKEQLRRFPQNGIGFGMLRHLSEDAEIVTSLSELPQPEINFLYLGQFDGGSSGMQLLQTASGPPCSPQLRRLHLFELVAFIQNGSLQVEISYSANRHSESSAEALAQGFVDELKSLIAHCKDPEAGGRTPSDFPAASVSQSDLDKLMSKLGGKRKGFGK